MSIRQRYENRLKWLKLWEIAFPGVTLAQATEMYARARKGGSK